MKKNRITKRITAVLLSLILVLSELLLFMPQLSMEVQADDQFEKNTSNTGICTEGILYPSNGGWPGHWGGEWSYVYYGKYNGNPVRYRVLDMKSADFGVEGGSVLLDCDNVLEHVPFSTNGSPKWDGSNLQKWMNGNSFLNNDSCFTEGERNAIAYSTKNELSSVDVPDSGADHSFIPLKNEKIFALDNSEICSGTYGYLDNNGNQTHGGSVNRLKTGADGSGKNYYYWTRNLLQEDKDMSCVVRADEQYPGSFFWTYSAYVNIGDIPIGASPAFNIARSSIVFSTKISDEKEFKLTLRDDSLSAGVKAGCSVTRNGNTLTIPYTVSGSPNRLSLLITYKYWWSDVRVRYYGELTSGTPDSSGTVTFTLPEDLGTSDRFYLVAEKTNGRYETDYAGTPTEITVPTVATVSFDANGGTASVQTISTMNGKISELPEAEREDCYFDGWYTSVSGGEKVTKDTVFSGEQTVYAHWVPCYTVSFDANEGSVATATALTNKYRKLSSLPTPSRTDHYFIGWYTSASGGEEITIDTVFFEDTTVYAHWAPMYYINENGIKVGITGATRIEDSNAYINLDDGWYYADGEISVRGIQANTGSKLILCDGCRLNVSGGITVIDSFSIYCQSEGNGTLDVYIDQSDFVMSPIANAGIEVEKTSGKSTRLDIYGGIINATGGYKSPGIGGPGSIPQLSATAKGGGMGVVSIHGGKVTARPGSQCEYGIGPGKGTDYGAQGTIILSYTSEDDYVDAGRIGASSVTLEKNFRYGDSEGNDHGAVTVDGFSDKSYIIKPAKQGLSFASESVNKTYGDASFTNTLSGATEGSTVTYSSSDEDVATVDVSGKVTIRKAGCAEITAKVSAAEGYIETSCSYQLNVAKKSLSLTGLLVSDKEYDGTDSVRVAGNVQINGLKEADRVFLITGSVKYSDTNVGSDIPLIFSDYSIDGPDKDNFILSVPTDMTASITARKLTIQATDKQIQAGDEVPSLAAPAEGTDYTVSGLLESDSLGGTIAMAYSPSEVVNTKGSVYDITVSGATAPNANYELEFKKGTLTVEQLPENMITPEIVTVPSVDAIVYGKSLGDIELSGGKAMADNEEIEGSFSWKNAATIPAVSDSEITEYEVVFTPTDSMNYNTASCKIKLTVNKADIITAKITAPTAKSLTYNSSEQSLVNEGRVADNDGTVQYAVGTDATAAPAESAYTESVPKAKNVGTYYVWYRVKGDANHNDVAASSTPISVGIARAESKNLTINKSITPGTTDMSVDISSSIPADVGSVTGYALGSEGPTGDVDISGCEISSAGVITATLSNGRSGNVIMVPVTITVQNYASCKAEVKITLVNPHSHYYTATVTKEATCTEDGERTYRCSCGSYYAETIKAEGHKLTHHEAVEATTEKDGNTEYWTCEVCGKYFSDATGKTEITKEQTILPKSKHKLTLVPEKKATCTEDGNKAYYTCSDCDTLFEDAEGTKEIKLEDTVIKAEGHKLTHHEAVEATTEKEGNIEYWTCEVCGKFFADAEGKVEITEEQTILPKSEHKLALVPEKKATCEEDGNKAYYTCSHCDKLFEDAEGKKEITEEDTVIRAEGHKLTYHEAVEPTVEEEGNIEYWTCEACGKFFADAEGKTEITEEETKIEKLKDIADCTVSGLATKAYTGKAVTPVVTLKYDGKILKKGADYTVTYANNTKAGTATVTIKGMGDYAGTVTKKFLIKQISFKYRAYVQKKNWMSWSTAKVSGTEASKMAGTTQDLRMETIQMQLSGVSGSVEYRAYCSKKGWTQWATTADTKTYAGTKGEARRVELIQLRAKGQVASLYDMYFRAYSEKLGWLNWAKSGEKAGTQGYAYKLEAFQVNFVIKGETFKLATQNKMAKSFYDKTKDGANPN